MIWINEQAYGIYGDPRKVNTIFVYLCLNLSKVILSTTKSFETADYKAIVSYDPTARLIIFRILKFYDTSWIWAQLFITFVLIKFITFWNYWLWRDAYDFLWFRPFNNVEQWKTFTDVYICHHSTVIYFDLLKKNHHSW